MAETPMIEARGLTKRYGPVVALAGIDLEVACDVTTPFGEAAALIVR